MRKVRWDWAPYLVYSLLALAILGPFLKPGYILTLDMVFVPHFDSSSFVYGLDEWWPSNYTPVIFLIQLGSKLVPAWLIQKAILFLAFFFAGLGAHRLFPYRGSGAYFAGLLYMINPFTYARFLAGHWGLLVAYAVTPFAIKAFIELLERGGKRDVIKVVLLSTLVGIVLVHGYFLLFLAFLVIFLVRVIAKRREPAKLLHASKCMGISAAIFLALSLYWLVPYLTASKTLIQGIGPEDLLFFAPKAVSGFGTAFDVASMHGFWREGYLYTKDILPVWWLLFAFILLLAVYGFLVKYRHQRLGWVVVSFAVLGVVSYLLALGAASDFTRAPFEWAYEHIPFFRGFRDSQKFVALLCLAYAFLGGLGVREIIKPLRRLKLKRKLPVAGVMTLAIMLVLSPIAYSFSIFGFQGQLGTTDYPQEWYEVNEYLNQDDEDFQVLFMPWHLYMDFSWLPNRDKRLWNPALQFFDKPIIAGDNIELPDLYSQVEYPVSKYVEFLLDNRDDIENVGELLAPLNVKYIILAHEADYEAYNFLYRQADLAVGLERQGITLFENLHPRAKIYGVDSVVHIENLEQYLEQSKTQDVMEHLYLLGSGNSSGEASTMEVVEFEKESAVKYHVQGSQSEYLVFTVSRRASTEHWEYDGQQAMKNLGFMPAFESDGDGGELTYTRFYRVHLPCYIISLVTLAVVVGLYFFPKPKRR